MHNKTSIVVTSIAAPNAALRTIAAECKARSLQFYVVGDDPSPSDFQLDGCDFYSVDRQLETGFSFAGLCPRRHYARKNIGYLLAMRDGSSLIVETDDDNLPRAEFWNARAKTVEAPELTGGGWVNVYRYFTGENVWPRGLPLDAVQAAPPEIGTLPVRALSAPIQQGLADDNPDVDAIYRLILPLPVRFAPGRRVALGAGTWCPFNSQNTAWWPEAFPLLYLPAYCSFRMTDIWRSMVAQRIAWENGWSVLFESPTVYQERNDHNLMRDFADEIPGYMHNRRLAERLAALSLAPGLAALPDNLRRCYEVFVSEGVVDAREFPLLDAWLADTRAVSAPDGHSIAYH